MSKLLLGTCAVVALAASGVGVALATGSTSRLATSRVTVTAKEFKFSLSRRTVPVGKVIFTVVNKGKIGHNFKIAGKKTPLLRPGRKTTLTVVFRKRGKYTYICTVRGHARLGMKGVLNVGSSSTSAAGVSVIAKEFKFSLSRRTVPVGKVIFTVVNKGKIGHDFKIAGKKTPLLRPGKKTTLTVVFRKKGKYTYICTVPGHARLGMRGVLMVGTSTVAATTTTAATTTPTVTVGNVNTTVTVGMFEYRFALSRSSIPSGHVTFAITNDGTEVHNFDILGVKAGAVLSPGMSETWTVALPPRTYEFQCDVPFHAERGMVGTLTVTPT